MKAFRICGVSAIITGIGLVAYYLFSDAERPLSFLWLPIILLLSLGVTILVWPVRQFRSKDAELEMLLQQLFPQTRAIKWTMYQVVVSLLLFLFGIVFWRWEVGLVSSILKTAVVAFLIIIGLTLCLRSLIILARHDGGNYKSLERVLSKEMASIVWVYEMPIKVAPDVPLSEHGETTIFIWLQEGIVYSFLLAREQIRPLFTFLRHRAPHATFGYNMKLAQIYQVTEKESV